MGLFPIFPEALDMDIPQLLFMLCIYGYILMTASQMIGNGSEMLLLLYGPGIVGGLVLPIMGAIPDCAVILISGMGSGTKAEIQDQLSVGVGTLVGSTALLLTLPWGAAAFLGRRDYDPINKVAASTESNKPKYTKFDLKSNCITTFDDIPGTAKIMMAAALSYAIIQIPAFFYKNSKDFGVSEERPFALTALLVTFVGFCAYCYRQYSSAATSELLRRQTEQKRREHWKAGLDKQLSHESYQEMIFRKHDKDNSGFIEAGELSAALAALGLKVGRRDLAAILKTIDTGDDSGAGANDGKISMHEFKSAVSHWVGVGQSVDELEKRKHSRKDSLNLTEEIAPLNRSLQSKYGTSPDHSVPLSHEALVHAEEEEEEDEEEEEFWHLTDQQLKIKAVLILLFGTAVCTIFSDPLVDVISCLGTELNISAFYISFVVTPLASNASEIIASLMFARKKTTESISLTLATLHGAATMNSTLALCIFMSLVYFRELSWNYTAECICVLSVIFVVGLNGLKTTIFLWQGVLVACMYPMAILIVFILESVFKLD